MSTRTLIAVLACTAALHAPVAHAAPDAKIACGTTAEDRVTSRGETDARSRSWLDAQVPYSQQSCYQNEYGSYRTDCSGYVSMAWGLTHSRTTVTLRDVAAEIPRADLRLGDALTNANHAALFVRWADVVGGDGGRIHARPLLPDHRGLSVSSGRPPRSG